MSALVLTGLGYMSCDKDGDNINKQEQVDLSQVTGYIIPKSESNELQFPYGGSSKTIKFLSIEQWGVIIPEGVDWIEADKMVGDSCLTSTIKVKITTKANPSEQAREAVVSILTAHQRYDVKIMQDAAPRTMTADEVKAMGIDVSRVNKSVMGDINKLYNTGNEFSFARCRVKGNVIVFWDDAYGDNDPNSEATPQNIRVDIDDFLEKTNLYYDYYANTVKMVELGKSVLDDYYMVMMIYGTTNWRAEGGGTGNMGCAWISATACQPTGSTICHEMGHSFQNQSICDGSHASQGAHWEDFANWMSYSQYAEEGFNSANFANFCNNCHTHFHSTAHLYAGYWFQYEWTDKYGLSAFGDVWRNCAAGEDMCQSYMRQFCNGDVATFNKDVYEYAAKCATWDFSTKVKTYEQRSATIKNQGTVAEYGKSYMGKIGWKAGEITTDGYFFVSKDIAPEATGFNLCRIELPEGSDRNVSVKFVGVPKASGYSTSGTDKNYAGWTVGYVALLSDGSKVYSDSKFIGSELEGELSWEVPANTDKLWYVVACTPQKYYPSGAGTWPYKLSFSNTNIYPSITIAADAQKQDVTIEKDVELKVSEGFTGPIIMLDSDDIKSIGKAFCMQPYLISGSSAIKFGALEPDGTVNYTTTTSAVGQWFNSDGKVVSWGKGQYVYSDFTAGSWSFQLGLDASSAKAGDKCSISQCLTYGDYKAVIKFNITIVE